jgi:alpha-L-fucosidase
MRVHLIAAVFAASSLVASTGSFAESTMNFQKTELSPQAEPMQKGRFEPTWESLMQYEVPEWFRDAKFGIWAHWGPQCAPEASDWYARHMYEEGHWQYKAHLQKYGHPSQFGFKDVIHSWKAEKFDPEAVVALYKDAGAKYFFALANHHDNFDLWESKYQPWNSVNLGPKQNLIDGWAKAARKNGLRFGVSVHAAHAWTWYEPAQGADKEGDLKGVPYDGKLTKADGKGTWWEGYNPQDLYAQNHPRSNVKSVHTAWHWTEEGTAWPDARYTENIYNRTIDLINKYHPDAVYFDDTVLPLYPISDIGLKITAHYYNASEKWHGRNEAVVMGKILNDQQRRAILWDVERGASDKLEPIPWQTCTCIGSWHYDRGIYDRKQYKSAATVIHMLADVVSKNGNLLLSVPLRSSGEPDELEVQIVKDIGTWMKQNGEAIYGTRPWAVYGEGPVSEQANPMNGQGFNEGKAKYGPADIRFTAKGTVVYAIVMAKPDGAITIKSFGKRSGLLKGEIKAVQIVGVDGAAKWSLGEDGLTVDAPATWPNEIAPVVKVELK